MLPINSRLHLVDGLSVPADQQPRPVLDGFPLWPHALTAQQLEDDTPSTPGVKWVILFVRPACSWRLIDLTIGLARMAAADFRKPFARQNWKGHSGSSPAKGCERRSLSFSNVSPRQRWPAAATPARLPASVEGGSSSIYWAAKVCGRKYRKAANAGHWSAGPDQPKTNPLDYTLIVCRRQGAVQPTHNLSVKSGEILAQFISDEKLREVRPLIKFSAMSIN